MKVLVIGSGGREHAIAWKLAQSRKVTSVVVAPGNGGTAHEAKCRNLALKVDPETAAGQAELIAFARAEGIALTVVGPEASLAAGIVDRFRAEGLAIIGPDGRAAQLEASKVLSKEFMVKYGVRAARSRTASDYDTARKAAEAHFAESYPLPLVVKADGLAAGKGVVVAESFAQADEALRSFLAEGSLGDAGKTVLLEDFLKGVEVSVLAAVSSVPGKEAAATILPFASARDHKRRFEGAQGPNTGGMGAIAPVPDFTPAAQEDFRTAILEPTLRGLVAEGFDYRGFIFFGLMIDGERCSLLEYNVRLGDPETQAVLPLMDSDLVELCEAMLSNDLGRFPLRWKKGFSCAPVAVADGYPGTYRKGDVISIDAKRLSATGAKCFAAGASVKDGAIVTSGGRVLSISAVADSPEKAREKAYAGLRAVSFAGMGFRLDIGAEKAAKA